MTPPGTLQPPTARVNYWLATGRDAPRTDDEKPERANLFLGVTIHTQAEADSRIPLLLQTPVAVRWVECVPREEICVARWFGPQTEGQWLNVVECGHDRLKYGIGWLYVTGERGPDARPLQSIIEQCRSAGVPVWADGTDFNELPQLQK